jgi:putative membrane protein
MPMMGLMLLFWAFFVGLIAVGVVLLLRLLGRQRNNQPNHDTALATLRERFARGEIDAAEYQVRRRVLEAERGHDADSAL